MRKLGHGVFAGARRLRGSATLRQRSSAPARGGFDEEAPAARSRRLLPVGMHAAEPEENEDARMLKVDVSRGCLEDAHFSSMCEDDQKDLILARRDKHWDEKRQEAGAENFDEEEVLTQYAKEQLLMAESNAHLMLTADLLIEEDWLGKVDALPGNIYRLAVIGDIFVRLEGETLTNKAQAIAKIFGIMTIVTIQMVGPPLIFMSSALGIGVLHEDGFNWKCCPWAPSFDATSNHKCAYHDTPAHSVSHFDDWDHIIATKALGLTFMVAFILNGLFVVVAEKSSWTMIYNTFNYLDVKNDKFKLSGRSFLYIDAFINIWVVVWCCIDVYVVIGPSVSPSEVLMNALSLVFLYNLDDVGGDLGFVSDDDWPGLRLAWIYDEVVSKDVAFTRDEEGKQLGGQLASALYSFTIGILTVMLVLVPALAALTPFIQIVHM